MGHESFHRNKIAQWKPGISRITHRPQREVYFRGSRVYCNYLITNKISVVGDALQPKKNNAREATTPPTTNPTNTPNLGLTSPNPLFASPTNKAEFFICELVLPIFSLSTPECPFEVASTAGATLAVFLVLPNAVVANVFVARLIDINGSSGRGELELEKKTRAKLGAGTGIVHESLPQLIVFTSRVPRKRPSTVKSFPRV